MRASGMVSSDFIGSMLTIRFKQLLFIDRYSDGLTFTNIYVTVHFKDGHDQVITPYNFESLFAGVIFQRTTVETE